MLCTFPEVMQVEWPDGLLNFTEALKFVKLDFLTVGRLNCVKNFSYFDGAVSYIAL